MGTLEWTEEQIDRNAEKLRRARPNAPPPYDGEKAARAIAESYGFTLEALRSPCRSGLYVAARRAISRRLKFEGHMSYPAIGHLLNRDHSSIQNLLWGKRKHGLRGDGNALWERAP
jgi:chromosomal replication initiation ATPase DnaA